jgi:predicted kinase
MKTVMTRDEVLNLLAGAPNSKRFIMMIGIPGSGKSNLAKALVKMGVERLCTDRIQKRNPMIAIQPYLLLDHFYGLLKLGLKQGRRIVDDNPNLRAGSRRKVLKMVAAAGYTDVVLVHMDTPLELCLRRNKQRSRIISDADVLDKWREFGRYGALSSSEGRIIRIVSQSVDETLFEVEF